MGTFWNCVEGSESIILPLYYWVVSREWKYPIATACVIQGVLLIVGYFYLEESPKWLYENKRYQECYQVLKNTGKVNGVQF